jgi:hypothetical protein
MADSLKRTLLRLVAHSPVVQEKLRADKEARYNSPEAKRARSERSRKAAATVRARRETQERLEADMEAREPNGPVCGAFGIIPIPSGPHETTCARPPHRHGDHENVDGDRWPSYEGEYDEMLIITTTHLRQLLNGTQEEPVLFVSRDGDTGEPVGLDVWAGALVPHGDVVVRQHDLVDALGGPDHPDEVTDEALEPLLEGYQAEVDAMEEKATNQPRLLSCGLCFEEDGEEVHPHPECPIGAPADACVSDGVVHPEHDYPPEGEGNECRRCGAEAEDITEPDGVYNGEIR